MRSLRVAVSLLLIVGVSSAASASLFMDDFEAYAPGSALHGQGGWKGWGNDPGAGAPASNVQASSGSISAEIAGGADLVHEFNLAGGIMELSAMQYIPTGATGTSFFILLNTYDDAGASNDWSLQTEFNLDTGAIAYWHGGSGQILYDQWVKLKYIIDLDNNTVDKYYNGGLITTDQWDDNVNGTLQCIDLFANGASAVYYDDITVTIIPKAKDPDPADGDAKGATVDGDNVYMLLNYTPGPGVMEHKGYFADNWADVNDRVTSAYLGTPTAWPTPGTIFVVGLDDDTLIPNAFARLPLETDKTYYWCVDEWDGSKLWPGEVWSFMVMPQEAWGPTPADGETFVTVDPEVTLSWKIGALETQGFTVSYDVYWGTDEAAVEAATTGGIDVTGGATSTVVTGLPAETEIFWRVDTKRSKPPFTTTDTTKGVVWSFTSAPKGIGTVIREKYSNIPGAAISALLADPNYPDNPDDFEICPTFEGLTEGDPGWGNDFGTRMRAWLYIQQSGDYTFWISTDDAGQFFLSQDENMANAVLIAEETGWSGTRVWNNDESMSDPIYLEGGKRYAVMALMKEAGGGDNMAVAYQGPDQPDPPINGDPGAIIPGKYLKNYKDVYASGPTPADGAIEVPVSTTLTWTAGIDEYTDLPHATQHVYFGTDEAAVAAADTTSDEYKGLATGNSYGPATVDYFRRCR